MSMGSIANVLMTMAILAGVCLVWMVLGVFAYRYSGFYLAVLAMVVLPVSYWRRQRVARMCLLFLVAAVVLAASPVDFLVRSETHAQVRLLPARYGIACTSDEACYGCWAPLHPSKAAVVVDL
jgi:hypothetical protein